MATCDHDGKSARESRRRRAAVCALVAGACLLGIAAPGHSAPEGKSIRALGDRDYPPITYLENGAPNGFDVDLVAALAEVMGREIRVELLPWDLAQKDVREGKAEILIGMSVTAERKKSWDFATPTLTRSFSVFVLSKEVGIRGVNDLRGKRVGVTTGGLPQAFLQTKPGVILVPVPGYQEGFDLLRSGSVDAVAADTWVAGYILNKYRIPEIAVAGLPFATLEAAIAVPKGNPALLREINEGLEKLRQRGAIENIRQKWEPKQVVYLLKEQVTTIVVQAAAIAVLILLAGMTAWIATLKRQVRARRRVENALGTSENRYRLVVETMAEGLVLLDMSGKVLLCNRAAERILRVPAAEIMRWDQSQQVAAVRADGTPFPPQERPSMVTMRTGRSRTGVVMGILRDAGSITWLSVNSAALLGKDGVTPDAVLLTFFDISGLKQAEQALRDHAEQLRQLSRRLFEVEESERRRLSRELHDRIGQNLTALSLNLNLVRNALPAGVLQATGARLDDSELLLASTAQLVRDVLADLRPPGLDELGLLAALREHAGQVAKRSGLKLEVSGSEPQPRLPPTTEIALFRIAQEALTNVVKHAQATAVSVSLRSTAQRVTLTVADDGCGLDPAGQPAGGMGMTSMRERAQTIGARSRTESSPGQGTRLIVEVPRAPAQAAAIAEQA